MSWFSSRRSRQNTLCHFGFYLCHDILVRSWWELNGTLWRTRPALLLLYNGTMNDCILLCYREDTGINSALFLVSHSSLDGWTSCINLQNYSKFMNFLLLWHSYIHAWISGMAQGMGNIPQYVTSEIELGNNKKRRSKK